MGNILIGGLIGITVDAATGADNDYPNAFQVPMVKVPGSPETRSTPPAKRAEGLPTS